MFTHRRFRPRGAHLFAFFAAVSALLAALVPPCMADPETPFKLPPAAEIRKLRKAIISTNRGDIFVELYPEAAPWHVANFKYLADKGFYRGLQFHLVYENYIVQGGDPQANGKGGPGYTLPAEFSNYKHTPGTLGMARRRGSDNPERRSNGSQFHFIMRDASWMDNNFTIFGRVVDGMKVVRKLRVGDQIESIVVYVTQ